MCSAAARSATERALIGEYRASIEEVLATLTADNHALAVEIARIPEQIKGFGHVKERHLAAAPVAWQSDSRAPAPGGLSRGAGERCCKDAQKPLS
jgi:indolepyruvate ferredoxin oxidoreductase